MYAADRLATEVPRMSTWDVWVDSFWAHAQCDTHDASTLLRITTGE
ncbi:hypothetical protein [Nocardioides flavescens]|uniref:Uncharacterized protein n=1 Tax=Nocardioides flavescens TaxID=2691959 RepID=A0A6L7EP27_9ACTN|nr:hypothetical protein [Nocardioides flavescens]MXG88360.1 hypothetical protein [Nocardioides flavescens]